MAEQEPAREAVTAAPTAETREGGLRRQLTAGQMAMVAVGGSIGTGLFLGSGDAVRQAGPAILVSYLIAAVVMVSVAMALGEMASVHPAAGSFGVYAEMYLNDWAGFISRYGYWIAIAIAIGDELVASATYLHYWLPAVPAVVWVFVFAALLLGINLRRVGEYGAFEYWFAMIKLVTILAFIVAGAALLGSGRVAPQYTASGGFFPNGAAGIALAMPLSIFTFAGVEMVAISSGEARSQREIPRAVVMCFGLLLVVYLGAMAVLVGVMPWEKAGIGESPFVTVFGHVGLPAASHVMNFVVLTAALSAANASLYVDSRMLFSLARGGYAPAAFGRLNAMGAPVNALLLSSFGIVLALIMERWAPKSAFLALVGAALFGVLISWLVSLAAHVAFRRRMSRAEVQGLPLRSPGGAALSLIGAAALIAVMVAAWWWQHIAVIAGVLYVVVLTAAYLAAARSKAARGVVQ